MSMSVIRAKLSGSGIHSVPTVRRLQAVVETGGRISTIRLLYKHGFFLSSKRFLTAF